MDHNEMQKSDDMEKDSTKPIVDEQKPPDQAAMEYAKNNYMNSKKPKSCIIEKLTKTRNQLDLIKTDLECNSAKAKKNDKRVLDALNLLSAHIPIVPKKSTDPSPSTSKKLENKDVQSTEHLQAVIEGFEQLVLKLAQSNSKFLKACGNAAQSINILKDLPLFKNIEKERKKLKGSIKRINDSVFSDEETKQVPHNILDDDVKKNTNTSIEKFCKYINSMLNEQVSSTSQKAVLEKFKCFPRHIDDLETFSNDLVQEGIGIIVEEEIRINSKNNHQSFICMSNNRERDERDAFISLPVARRYAFHGDIVRAFVLNLDYFANKTREPIDESEPESCIESAKNSTLDRVQGKENSAKAFVIKIIKQTELREVVGSIIFAKTTLVNSERYYTLKPYDTKISMVYIPADLCKEELKNISKEDVCGMIYVARILDIDIDGNCIGELIQPIGKIGMLQAEIDAILLNNGLKDLKPYEEKYQEMFEGPIPPPSDEDLKPREDLRKKCIFTIDPLTAKDLDDAVSIEKLNCSEYEIGVHISDVSYYLQENTDLDNIVKNRATSVYLVNRVIHMLPTSLCLRCSLLPGEDKFAFSVFWKWHTEKQELSEPRFVKSIINSCSQLAYEHAQKIIDNPTEDLETSDLPDIFNKWTPNDVKSRILSLHQIAQTLRDKRYENGAISLNNPKMRVQLDPKSGEPVDIGTESRQESQFLIEEFMLLANQSVAKHIHNQFPDKSILRQHSPPIAKQMNALKIRLEKEGFDFDITSSKTVYESMQRLCREAGDPKAMEAGLNDLLTKPMSRAKYFCSEGKTSEAAFWHYGLSIPIYTHFTSPIRRYADITVHRLLAAALNYCPPPQRTTDELHQLAAIMNSQKIKAKNAGDDALAFYFKRYLKAKEAIVFDAVVTEIGEYAVNVVIIETGHNLPIVYRTQENIIVYKNCIYNKSGQTKTKLQLFSNVQVKLKLKNDKIVAFLASSDESNRHNSSIISDGCSSLSCEEDVKENKSHPAPSRSKSKRNKKPKQNKKGKQSLDYCAFYAIKD